ncbi:MAG: SIMPL domain-containing protein, partial [Lysobacterales bacterium]
MNFMVNQTSTVSKLNLIIITLLTLLISTVSLADDNKPISRILVTGECHAELAPDMAILTLTVTREAETARDALDANSDAMAEVLTAMKAAGIRENDLQTSGFSIQP